MKTWRKLTTIPLVIAAVTALTGIWTLQSVSAATGTIYLTPGSSSVQNGSTLTLSLRINPGATVDGVQATVNFDTSKLQYVSADVSGSAFSAQLQQSQSGGTVTIARGDFSGGISTDSLIESITFKALVGSGSSSVTLTNANATDHSTSQYTNPSVGNATVNFTTPATPPPTCPTGQIGTPPNCTTPPSGGGGGSGSGGSGGGNNKGGGGSKHPGSTTTTATTANAPVLTAQTTAFISASFTVTSQVPTQVYIQYGTNQATMGQQTALSSLGTTHTVALDSSTLTPGETYYYIIVSKDTSGHIAQSSVQQFKLKGLTVTVGVYDKNQKPLKNQTVTLHSTPVTGKTNDKGLVTFSDVIPGAHEVMYSSGGKSYNEPITVLNNVTTVNGEETAPVQNVSVVYGFAQSNTTVLRAVSLALLVIIVVLAAVFYTRRKVRVVAPGGAPLSMEPVVVNGKPTKTLPPSNLAVTNANETTSQQLDSIPDPDKLAPGSTVTPVESPESDSKKDEQP